MATVRVTVGPIGRSGKNGQHSMVFSRTVRSLTDLTSGASAAFVQDPLTSADYVGPEDYTVARIYTDGPIRFRIDGVATATTGTKMLAGDTPIDVRVHPGDKISVIDVA